MGILNTERAAIKKHFLALMDERTQKLRSCALWDLYYGPHSAEYYSDAHELDDWPGYVSALHHLEEWADLNLMDVWVDENGDIADREPEGETIDGTWVEPAGYAHFDRKSVKSIVFEKLVSDGGMN